ncbi:unnamed protein product [Rotaria sordida]|uniref:Uncharacterized protein n=1 Tax=Rotaria sordida TaxID=392033 RepID=A0A813VKG3_9BILA|nr:unnamed protein product [Rotaria sordida]CAF0875545.1 unnamed protein product [Rotaria sordida]
MKSCASSIATPGELQAYRKAYSKFGEACILEIIAEKGDDAFYTGELADLIVKDIHDKVIGHNGNALAMISTINLYFGSMVFGTETDIIYNNQINDFSTLNTTNFFGVPACLANYITPGKRPSSSIVPLIMFDQNNPHVLEVLNANGGTKITTTTAQVVMLNLWFRKDIRQAINTPRLHSQLLPEEVLAECGFNQTILEQLKKLDHNIQCGVYRRSIVQSIE